MHIGAIFDWDGVIIDSSRYHQESWKLLAAREGRKLPPLYFKKSFGMRNETIIPEVLEWTNDPEEIARLADLKEEIYRDIMKKRGISPLPGVRTFLELLRSHRIPAAIGSSTPRRNITAALDSLGFGHYFHRIVAAEDVTAGKPDPQVFVRAAHELRLPPESCVVFEDALVGIQAARKGGMKVAAVTTTNPASALATADLVVNRLDEISISTLHRLIESTG